MGHLHFATRLVGVGFNVDSALSVAPAVMHARGAPSFLIFTEMLYGVDSRAKGSYTPYPGCSRLNLWSLFACTEFA
jgi:hypothetical protein